MMGERRVMQEAVFACTFATAAMTLGYLSVQSSPVRVKSCTRRLSMRA